MSKTPLDALVSALEDATSFNKNTEAAPEAILWCDANQDFAPLIPLLRERLPQLLTYGDINPETRTGPGIWLRAAAAGELPDLSWPEGTTPIVYVPSVGREVLRSADDCPPLLQPLVWLTVAGTMFGHVNSKDWSLKAFLSAERGDLKLDLADDAATKSALKHAASRIFTIPIQELRSKRWDAEALHALVAPDLKADMLDWMEGTLDPKKDPDRFAAFAALAKSQMKFDPTTLSRQDAASKLAQLQGKWKDVWKRFEQSNGYHAVVSLLNTESPVDLFADKSTYPKLNVEGEVDLREALHKLSDLNLTDAKARILELEDQHAWRRKTVWARRGESPLAQALEHLAYIAKAEQLPPHDGKAFAEIYTKEGCKVDWAACQALALVPREMDRSAITEALRAVYMPWVEEGAIALQELVKVGKVRFATKPEKTETPTTFVFVDGLRMDVAQRLLALLQEEGAKVKLNWVWSGFPTVTATCKPLASPVAHKLIGPDTTPDVLPLSEDGKPASKPVLYKVLEAEGWNTTTTLISTEKLWMETGRFDEEGHALGSRLAERLESGLRDSADFILQLAGSGRSIRIVTDHGWLLMPGGFVRATLDNGLVETNGKRTRCAMVKATAETSYLTVPWSWNDKVLIATATGARAFFPTEEYAHGGISPQECILPIIDVEPLGAVSQAISIKKAVWQGLRLRIEVDGGADLRVDVRLGPDTSGITLINGGRVLDADGRTSVLVSDEYESKSACLVVLGNDNVILAHRSLIVGGE